MASKLSNASNVDQVTMQGFEKGKIANQAGIENSGDGTQLGQSGYVLAKQGASSDTQNIINRFDVASGSVSTDVIHTEAYCKDRADRTPDSNPNKAANYTSCINLGKAETKQRESELKAKFGSVSSKMSKIGGNAVAEQKAVSGAALASGMQSLVTGLTQTINGGFNLKGASQLEQAANTLDKIANQVPTTSFTPLAPGAVTPSDALAPGSGTALNPSTTTAAADTAVDAPTGGFGDLAPPSGSAPDTTPTGAPSPDAFVAGGTPGAPGGGSGGGGIGGASTSPAQADQGEPQAQLASQGRGGDYGGGGGSFGAPGGGGGVGADRGPDLSGLLAQFLPQKKDEEARGNGILDYGGRQPASEAPISLLDRSANIFERIHETYQDKNRRGRI
jgi:hypothetical protein